MPIKTQKRNSLNRRRILALLQRHEDVLRQYSVKHIGLLGSYARGEQRKRSDIDFLVEFREPTFDNFMDLAFYLEKILGKRVELVTEGGMSRRIRPFVEKEVKWHEVR
ncbi:MAG: nucleotidyltransferase family protein [Acidobacteria bacterium]|nr:nucleotidyltransferase family protein [Acidobacteriota bacterium]